MQKAETVIEAEGDITSHRKERTSEAVRLQLCVIQLRLRCVCACVCEDISVCETST